MNEYMGWHPCHYSTIYTRVFSWAKCITFPSLSVRVWNQLIRSSLQEYAEVPLELVLRSLDDIKTQLCVMEESFLKSSASKVAHNLCVKLFEESPRLPYWQQNRDKRG